MLNRQSWNAIRILLVALTACGCAFAQYGGGTTGGGTGTIGGTGGTRPRDAVTATAPQLARVSEPLPEVLFCFWRCAIDTTRS